MATGIVEVFAKAGYDVLFTGRGQDKVDGVVATITKNFDKQIQRGRATEEQKSEVLGRVTGTTSLDDLATVDIVVEAIAEDLAITTNGSRLAEHAAHAFLVGLAFAALSVRS